MGAPPLVGTRCGCSGGGATTRSLCTTEKAIPTRVETAFSSPLTSDFPSKKCLPQTVLIAKRQRQRITLLRRSPPTHNAVACPDRGSAPVVGSELLTDAVCAACLQH